MGPDRTPLTSESQFYIIDLNKKTINRCIRKNKIEAKLFVIIVSKV